MLHGHQHILTIVLTFKQFGAPGKSKCRFGPPLSLGFKQLARALHASLSWRRVVTTQVARRLQQRPTSE
jgi:hypothetical protein